MRQPFYNRRRECWYVWLAGKQTRLDAERDKAFDMWRDMMTPSNESRVAAVVRRFLDRPRKPSTQRFYESHLNLFIKKAGHLRVCDLRGFHLEDLLDKYRGQNYRHNIGRCVKACFKWLAGSGHIAASPFANFRLPAAISRGDEAYLTDDQVAAILRSTEGDLNEILTFLARTGARPKEARLLEARHLYGQTVVFPKKESKGGRDQRVIHLPDEVFELVQRLRLKRPSGPLFLNGDKPWKAQALAERCERLSKRVGIEFSAYTLRHSWATNALLRGADIVSVATLMGHRGTKTLSAIYAHLERRDDHLQQVLQRVTA